MNIYRKSDIPEHLHKYFKPAEIGLEKTPDEYVNELVNVFREVKRVLRDDGTLWLNIGDSYNGSKNLIGIPWRVAFALQADGWYLRQDIIWHKPNPMPESVKDRCTKAHEYMFLLSRSGKYYFDAESISEPVAESTVKRLSQDVLNQKGSSRVPGKTNWNMKAKPPRFGGEKYGDSDDPHYQTKSGNEYIIGNGKRNKRTVWTVSTKPYTGAHFATFPCGLVEPCVLAGCPVNGTVLDPFGGSGTVGEVCRLNQRNAILIELNKEYEPLIRQRIGADIPELTSFEEVKI